MTDKTAAQAFRDLKDTLPDVVAPILPLLTIFIILLNRLLKKATRADEEEGSMTRLDEIEATNNVLATGASRADVELLIRAVRQLGAALKRTGEIAAIGFVYDFDPDVLELLKE
jgi:hypothetical protein